MRYRWDQQLVLSMYHARHNHGLLSSLALLVTHGGACICDRNTLATRLDQPPDLMPPCSQHKCQSRPSSSQRLIANQLVLPSRCVQHAVPVPYGPRAHAKRCPGSNRGWGEHKGLLRRRASARRPAPPTQAVTNFEGGRQTCVCRDERLSQTCQCPLYC
jgi:hypothetical protein